MSTTTAVETEVEQIDHVLGEEYEHKPVPLQARRSLFSVTMVWIGFPMIITGAMTGSVLVLGMGFQRALVAMIIGLTKVKTPLLFLPASCSPGATQ